MSDTPYYDNYIDEVYGDEIAAAYDRMITEQWREDHE
jgi:hypothetical protein